MRIVVIALAGLLALGATSAIVPTQTVAVEIACDGDCPLGSNKAQCIDLCTIFSPPGTDCQEYCADCGGAS